MLLRFAVVALCSVCIIATACSSDIHQRIVTTDNRTSLESAVRNDPGISDLDKNAFASGVTRSGYQPYGKTVAAIISDQRAYESERAAKLHALDSDIEIRPSAINVSRHESYGISDPYEDSDDLQFAVKNNGKKTIASFEATAALTNEGGDRLYSGTIEDASPLSSQSTEIVSITVTGMQPYVDARLIRATAVGSTLVRYTVNKIQYVDGTSIDRSDLGEP